MVVADNESTLQWLKSNNISILSTTPDTDKIYSNINLTGGVAIVVGTEHEGLSNFWLENADCLVKIPMQGQIDSLNASVSSAIVLYEAYRQRSFKV
jgi:TrmH family RNA methyltransferase